MGGRIRLKDASRTCLGYVWFGGTNGNPPVIFDSENPPTNPMLDMVDSFAVPAMAPFYEGVQVLHLNAPLNVTTNCNFYTDTTGTPEQVAVALMHVHQT